MRPTLLAPLLVLLATPATLAQEPADPDRLVADLGAEDWRTREQAEARLVEIGRPALPAVRAALDSGDPEIARRAARTVEAIEWPALADLPAGAVELASGRAAFPDLRIYRARSEGQTLALVILERFDRAVRFHDPTSIDAFLDPRPPTSKEALVRLKLEIATAQLEALADGC